MNTVVASTLLTQRFQQFARQRSQQEGTLPTVTSSSSGSSSIERTVTNIPNNTSIELPQAIDDLIDNKMYRNKFRKLMREGHVHDLLELAAMAQTKDHPSHWFARATKTTTAPGREGTPTNWERTLTYLAKLHQVALTAERVAKRLGTQVNTFIYQQIWKGVNVERWAVAAQEVGHDRPGQSRGKYFAWLCVHEKQLVS